MSRKRLSKGGVEIEAEEPLKKLQRLKTQRFIKQRQLSPHFLDPLGEHVYLVLHTAEARFGIEARKKLESILYPAQNVRILRELKKAGLYTKLDLLTPDGVDCEETKKEKRVKRVLEVEEDDWEE
ncbi:hypothetical protein [Archaeoglobus veneficus]|uniref:Uncharacterized protein n=2 Tax=root TaxID=1 RepID=F2KMG6_ARCVS|nr:hypothetical protein [Archaeoglobus veneficus]AEA46065.1 hypothetical protein Arcve_0021 [Archaeoglobus veneficus SNP6]